MHSQILSLSTLSLHHFRNYEHARVEVSSAPVVLYGHNGAGKTNILEAISLLAPGRGLRGAKLAELNPAIGGKNWVVTARLNGAEGEVLIGTGRDAENDSDKERREVRVDGRPAKAGADLARHIRLLWLTPQMEQLFQGSNSEARRFLDRLTYHFDDEHASHVNAYETSMRERNKLLEKNGDAAWLSAIEHAMAQKASAIAASRLSALTTLNNTIGESTLSFPKPHLKVKGEVEELISNGVSALQAEDYLVASLAANRNLDRGAGRTLVGTHRSELVVTHREKNMEASQCSTGEQKALLLSIILAQSRAGARWNGITPIILLDEVVAHLDPSRRLELFDEIHSSGAQVWMTGTDASLFDGMRAFGQFFEVKNGALSAG